MNTSDFAPLTLGSVLNGPTLIPVIVGIIGIALFAVCLLVPAISSGFAKLGLALGFILGMIGLFGFLSTADQSPDLVKADVATVKEWASEDYGLNLDDDKAKEIRELAKQPSSSRSALVEQDDRKIAVSVREDLDGSLHLMVAESELEPLETR